MRAGVPVGVRSAGEEAHQRPADVVADALRGSRPPTRLQVDHVNRVVFRGDAPVAGKVGLVSGGGSGHEPLHTGFVGPGMLDAACAGEVFSGARPILAATMNVDAGAKCYIVKNYTGDVMNFEMAADLAAAEGLTVQTVLVSDDVAVQDSTYTRDGGVGATVLVEKIAGAAADRGLPLEQVAGLARRVNAEARSMGMALTSCTVPAVGHPTFDLPRARSRSASGIHGEPGRRRVPVRPAGTSPRCWSNRFSPISTSPAG